MPTLDEEIKLLLILLSAFFSLDEYYFFYLFFQKSFKSLGIETYSVRNKFIVVCTNSEFCFPNFLMKSLEFAYREI